jgi:hypothetical protein
MKMISNEITQMISKKNVEDDFKAAGKITQVEMKMRLLNAKKPLTKAAEKVIRYRASRN